MKKIARSELNRLFAAISSKQTLYIPADGKGEQAYFTVWQEGTALSGALNTARSAKDLFFPQVENLMGFKVTGKQIDLIETRDETAPFVLFGVRACDCRSFDILDSVFLAEPADTYYQNRRSNATVVTMACSEPEETCFCGAFGIDAAEPAGDVTCWMDAESLYWRANTEKGEALTAELSMLEDADGAAVVAQQEKTREILKKLPLAGLNLRAVGAGKTKALFDGRSGNRSRRHVSAAAPARSSARPVSAMTFRNSITERRCAASAAGTAVCIRTSRKCPPDSRARRSSNVSVSALCTSWSTILTITRGRLDASAAAAACKSARSI